MAGNEPRRDAYTRRERASAARVAQQRAERKRRVLIGVGAVVLVAAIGGGVAAAVVSGSSSRDGASVTPSSAAPSSAAAAPAGPEGIALQSGTPLASLASAATGATVNGVQCNANEQVAYHVHSHLAIFVNGVLRPVTPGIGIVSPIAQQSAAGVFYSATSCYYWLHVHAQDGVIHVESPTTQPYTLGQFFAIWGQPLSAGAVGPATGVVTVFLDGRRFTGDPASIALKPHEAIQLDIGPVVPFQAVDWSRSQL